MSNQPEDNDDSDQDDYNEVEADPDRYQQTDQQQGQPNQQQGQPNQPQGPPNQGQQGYNQPQGQGPGGQQMGGQAQTETGLEPNVAAALSYLFTIITGAIFYVMEENNDYIRFHAMQSIILGIALIAFWIVFNMVLGSLFLSTFSYSLWQLYSTLIWLVQLGILGLIIFMMYKAYNGERYKLPVLGDIAENQVK